MTKSPSLTVGKAAKVRLSSRPGLVLKAPGRPAVHASVKLKIAGRSRPKITAYSIDPRGRITLNYADGHVVVETIAVMLNSGDSPDADYGPLLGESAYFGPDSEVGC